MLRSLLLTCLLYGACLFGCGLAIVLGTQTIGHNGPGMMVALAAEAAIWLGGLVVAYRLGQQARAVNRYGLLLPLGFLAAFLAMAAPLVIATALAFDH